MDKTPCVDRVSEYPAGSRQWWRDWSAFWMHAAQGAAKMSKAMMAVGFPESGDIWRRIAVANLRRSLKDYKRSLDAPDASEWSGCRP